VFVENFLHGKKRFARFPATGEESDSVCSDAAVAHGRMRKFARLLSSDAGPRCAHPAGDALRDAAEKPERSGF
jgi:hypothetical protein